MNSDSTLYDAFARYGSGVTLVTVQDGDQQKFFIAASVLTASVHPFTLAASVGQDRKGLPAIASGSLWAVSVLGTQHLPLVQQLTGPTSLKERFAALDDAGAEPSDEGPLWLPDSLATFWCSTHSTTEVHDQVLLVGQVERVASQEKGTPLVRWNRGFHTTSKLSTS